MFHLRYHQKIFVQVGVVDECGYLLCHFVEVVFAHFGNQNFLVVGGLRRFFHIQQLFIKFFAGAQSCVGYRYVDFGTVARQAYHFARQIGYLHRASHVENEYLAALAHRACFQYQLAGFGNGHKVANDVGVRYRYWTALLYLVAKQRNYRTVRAKHIAKTRGDEFCGVRVVHHTFLEERLHIDFGHTLRCAHHIGGVHRLVGRDHHKFLHTVDHRQIGYIACAKHICQDTFAGIVLHHRHMFVGRRVVDDVRFVGRYHARQTPFVAHIANAQGIRTDGFQLVQLQFQVVERRFGVVVQHQQFGLIFSQLAHNFGADRASRARYHYHFALYLIHDMIFADIDGQTIEQIFDTDIFEIVLHKFAALVPFAHIGHSQNLDILLDKHI